jgi:hypothetical protein
MQTVTLEQWELAIALLVGQQRTANMAHVPDALHYQRDTKMAPEGYTLDQVGAIAEMSVAKYTRRYWPASAWPAEQHTEMKDAYPDVLPDIEVRSVQQPHYRLVVRQGDVHYCRKIVKSQVHQHADGTVTTTLYGWAPAKYAWASGTVSPWGDETVKLLDDNKLFQIEKLKVYS